MKDPRGPLRKIVEVDCRSDANVLRFECGHEGRKNQTMAFKVGAKERCFKCGMAGQLNLDSLTPFQLRELADAVAREDGYRVKAMPVWSGGKNEALLVTFVAADGLTFPGSVPVERLAKHLG